jgi:hypothetical protein
MIDILSIAKGAGHTGGVPYALDDHGRLWAALSAPQGHSYRCLACGGHLTPQRRADRKAAFRHAHTARCDGSGVARLAARHLLREQLLEELQERGAVVWHRRCPGLDGICRDRTIFERWQQVPGWKRVEIEVTGTGDRFDVAVTDADGVRIGFRLKGGTAPPPDGAERSDENEEPNAITLSLDEVLAFGPREAQGAGGERCPGCEQSARRVGRGGIGWDEAWRGVMKAARIPQGG